MIHQPQTTVATYASSQAIKLGVLSHVILLLIGPSLSFRGGPGVIVRRNGSLDLVVLALGGGGIGHIIEVAIIGSILITGTRWIIEIVGDTIGGSRVELVLRAGWRRFNVRRWGVRQIAFARVGVEELHGVLRYDRRRTVSIDWTRFR